jgi:hypothetical protein
MKTEATLEPNELQSLEYVRNTTIGMGVNDGHFVKGI